MVRFGKLRVEFGRINFEFLSILRLNSLRSRFDFELIKGEYGQSKRFILRRLRFARAY